MSCSSAREARPKPLREIAVYIQMKRVNAQAVTRPAVLPDGSGMYTGAAGPPTGVDVIGRKNIAEMIIAVELICPMQRPTERKLT